MAHPKKYDQPTTNRTLTLWTKDLDTIQAHTRHPYTVTDHIQQAIKDYIRAQGWDQDQPATANPQHLEPAQAANPINPDQDDNGLPEELKRYARTPHKPG